MASVMMRRLIPRMGAGGLSSPVAGLFAPGAANRAAPVRFALRDEKEWKPIKHIPEPAVFVDDDNFEVEVMGCNKPVIVEAFADWCAPCKVLDRPLRRHITGTYGRVVLAKLDVDKAPQIAKRLEVTAVPTMILYKLGKEMRRVVGVPEDVVLLSMVDLAKKLSY